METSPWRTEDVLATPELVAEYLNQVMEDGDREELVRAIGYVAKARGMSSFARSCGMSRETLYASFARGGNPTLSTLTKALRACGVRLRFEPMEERDSAQAQAIG